ncbi:fibronectin type III domain-containing protein [Marinobacter lacisalsi]|uniref:Fibronectin type III domain-containing protein n=1 Tax=Marinobacter lacisalsi TaxID=475979 RepID=A0ABV8QM73_9GAMM
MAFQDERKRLSWSLMVVVSLAIAGCGGESGSSGTEKADSSQTGTTSQETRTTHQDPVDTAQDQTATPGEPDKSIAEDEDTPPPQIAQPGDVIENPIFADPIPVPVPEGEQPDSDTSDSDTGQPRDEPADSDGEPEVAEPEPAPEPKPEEPEPVAERPTLQWDSPLTRVDGSKLYPGEISGYRVYYRLRHQEEFESIIIEGPDSDSLALDNFDPGAYEFAVSTLDVDGLESRRSDPVAVDLI